MKKSRKDKGITLIALIITIIVLLILALVTINSITGDDSLIAHAQNAGTKYTTEGENENSVIKDYLTYIDDNIEKHGKTLNPNAGDLITTELLNYLGYKAWTPYLEGKTIKYVNGEKSILIGLNTRRYNELYAIYICCILRKWSL